MSVTLRATNGSSHDAVLLWCGGDGHEVQYGEPLKPGECREQATFAGATWRLRSHIDEAEVTATSEVSQALLLLPADDAMVEEEVAAETVPDQLVQLRVTNGSSHDTVLLWCGGDGHEVQYGEPLKPGECREQATFAGATWRLRSHIDEAEVTATSEASQALLLLPQLVELCVTNGTSHDAILLWCCENEREVQYGEPLRPGEFRAQPTFSGQTWRLRSHMDEAEVTATSEASQALLLLPPDDGMVGDDVVAGAVPKQLVELRVTNGTSHDAILLWCCENEREVQYGEPLRPGEFRAQPTFPGETWRLRRCLKMAGPSDASMAEVTSHFLYSKFS